MKNELNLIRIDRKLWVTYSCPSSKEVTVSVKLMYVDLREQELK